MKQYLGHLVRRGVEYTQSAAASHGDKEMPQMPIWGAVLAYLTVVVFVVFFTSLQYTLTDVVGTLAMVESPSHAILLPGSEEEADKKDDFLEQPQMAQVKPITSKIRGTIQHLTAVGGRWARWRAFVPATIYSFAVASLSLVLSSIVPAFLGQQLVCELVSAVMLARLHMVWTHAVISLPSPLRWYQRLSSVKSVRKLWVPTAISVLAPYVVGYLVVGVVFLSAFCNNLMFAKKDGASISGPAAALWLLQAIAIVPFAIAMCVLILIPAYVTLARVEASLLPEDQETIVPFDRTFGGKVIPEALGGTGAIGFVDAWKTFDWEARRRVVKLYLKIAVILTVVALVMVQFVALEAWAIMGSQVAQLPALLTQ